MVGDEIPATVFGHRCAALFGDERRGTEIAQVVLTRIGRRHDFQSSVGEGIGDDGGDVLFVHQRTQKDDGTQQDGGVRELPAGLPAFARRGAVVRFPVDLPPDLAFLSVAIQVIIKGMFWFGYFFKAQFPLLRHHDQTDPVFAALFAQGVVLFVLHERVFPHRNPLLVSRVAAQLLDDAGGAKGTQLQPADQGRDEGAPQQEYADQQHGIQRVEVPLVAQNGHQQRDQRESHHAARPLQFTDVVLQFQLVDRGAGLRFHHHHVGTFAGAHEGQKDVGTLQLRVRLRGYVHRFAAVVIAVQPLGDAVLDEAFGHRSFPHAAKLTNYLFHEIFAPPTFRLLPPKHA